jgi:hypothetical protein
MVASKFTTDMRNAQAEIEELVCHTSCSICCGLGLIIPPTETRVRRVAKSAPGLERREI